MSNGTIMIVPGIGGNDLFTPPTFFGLGLGLQVWMHPASLLAGAWLLLGLQPDGVTPSAPLTGVLTPGAPLQYFHSSLRDWFSARGWAVVGAALDWRGTLARDGVRLADQVVAAAGGGRVNLLCHSRGGLVARSALQVLAGRGQLGLVGRCAGLGVPHQGSWSGAALLAGWENTIRLLRLLLETLPGVLAPGLPLARLHTVVASWPACYELLPKPGASGIPAAQVASVYDAAAWAGIGYPVSSSWLAAAAASWPTLPDVPIAVEWVDVTGVGFVTADQLLELGPPRSPHSLTYTGDGDGYVLARWALQPGRYRITTPTSHDALISDGRLFEVLDGYYRNGLDHNVTIPGSALA